MSSSKSLIINCGASHVTYASFDSSRGSLVCDVLRIEPLEFDFSNDDAWLSAVLSKLKLISASVKKGDVTVIVPGYQLLSKGIKVPHVEASRQAQIIAFEAQQNIPYPLTEVVWGHQVIADDGVETDVMLVAFKSQAANRLCNAISDLGFKTTGVQAASLLDLNAYRYAYKGATGTTLLINIGARSSNLMFISETGCSVRNVSLGGNTLTQQLADKLGQPFLRAEQIKVGCFSGQMQFEEGDPTYDAIWSVLDGFLRRMNQEITRSIINYKRQNKGEAPSSILLTGRGSLIPGLAENLMETQKAAVNYFDPTQVITPGSGVDANFLANHYFQLSEVLGFACRSLLPDGMGVDLLPPAIAAKQAFAKKKVILMMAAACLPFAPIPAIMQLKNVVNEYQSANKSLTQDVEKFKNNSTEIEANIEAANTVSKKIQDIEKLVKSRSNWVNFFVDLQDRLVDVKDVWLEDLRVARGMPNDESKGKKGKNKKKDNNEEGTKAKTSEDEDYILRMSGKLLLRAEGDKAGLSPDEANRRVTVLMDRIAESEFIDKVYDPQWDATTSSYVLGFGFKLKVNPEKPL
jgi:type IV pilus assembly protein PilM